MARGPATGANRKVLSRDTVAEHWDGEAPDWIVRLADLCDGSSQNAIAKALGYSAATISNVLRNRYPADMSGIEDAVAELVAGGAVECPALGPITTEDCAEWRGKAGVLSTSNPQRVQMRAACLKCRRFKR